METREYKSGKLISTGSLFKKKETSPISSSVSSEDDEEITEDFDFWDPEAGDYSGIYDLDQIMADEHEITYYFHYAITRIRSTREITGVVQDPIRVDAMTEYIDKLGRRVIRFLHTDNHYNDYSILGTSITFNWSCAVYGQYNYNDGSTGYWFWRVSKSVVEN